MMDFIPHRARPRQEIRAAGIIFVALSLQCLFSSYCFGQTKTRGLNLPAIGKLPEQGKRWALIIGVDLYRDSQISPLRGAANDAQTLATTLVKHAGFPPDQVIVLATDQPEERQPTRVNILRRLSNLASIVPQDGLLLLSFAGHGMERSGQAFLLPTDAQMSDDLTFLEETAVSVTRLKDRIRATGIRQVLIFLDACRNDPMGRTGSANRLSKAYTQALYFDLRNREVQAFVVFYAAAIGERAYEYAEKRQGYFTWAIVQGLKGEAANYKNEVTLSALIKYVQENVPKRVGIDLGGGKLQRPFAVVEGYKADELVITGAQASIKIVASSSTTPPQPDPTKAKEISDWNRIKGSTNLEDYREFLRLHPNGQFTKEVEEYIAFIQAATNDQRPGNSPTPGVDDKRRITNGSLSIIAVYANVYPGGIIPAQLVIAVQGAEQMGAQDVNVIVNGKDVSSTINKQDHQMIQLSGKSSDLNLKNGKNEVTISIKNVSSSPYYLTIKF